MTPEECDAVRKLLIEYQSTLSVAEALAMDLRDILRTGALVQEAEALRERRRSVEDALALIESGDRYARRLWTDLGVERRAASPPLPRPAEGSRNRRRSGPRADD